MNVTDLKMPPPGQFGDEPIILANYAGTPEGDDLLLRNAGVNFGTSEAVFNTILPPFDWIVDGLMATGSDIQRGFKCDLISGSKGRKSFAALQLGLSVASGSPFCGFPVPKARKVLYVNFELIEKGLQERLVTMCDAFGIDRTEIWKMFTPVTVANPGRLRGDSVLEALIRKIRREHYELVIIDPTFRLLDPTEDECSGTGIGGILRFRDRLVTEAHACVLMVMHDPKGASGDRKISDRGAGSGFAGRDYDARITLTPHADGIETHVVLETSSRYRRNHPAQALVFDETTLTFSVNDTLSTSVETESVYRENRSEIQRVARNVDNEKRGKAVLANITESLGPQLIDQTTFISRFRRETGWGEDRSVGFVRSNLGGGLIASTPELQRKPDGSVKQILHAKTLIGSPIAVQDYIRALSLGIVPTEESSKEEAVHTEGVGL